MEHSIQFNSDINAKTIAYLLKYSLNYSNETNLLSDGFTHDREKNVFNLNLKLNYGTHTITFNDCLIDIEYTNKDIVLATADDIRKYETLVLSAKTQETLLDFIEVHVVQMLILKKMTS